MSHSIAEIAVLWVLFFILLKAVQRTRAIQFVQFVVLLLVLTYLFKFIGMTTVHWVLVSSQLPIFLGLVILYAPELRRAVSELSSLQIIKKTKESINPIVSEIAKAAILLSRRHVGALIVFENTNNLQGFIDTGIQMDSLISSELIVSIFSPLTPLHDGAIIIRNNRIAAAACLLPLSQLDDIDSSLGTRHRAALGLVEETDSIIVIVSEETGAISLALNSRITRDLDPEKFETILSNVVRKGVRV